MKIIDINLTVGGRDCNGKEIDLCHLLSIMNDYHIEHGVCYHQHALRDPKDGNQKMAALAEQANGKLSVCAVLDPVLGADNLPGEGSLLSRLSEFKPACVRIFPGFARLPFHAFYWDEILDAVNALSLPLIIDYEYKEEFLCNIPDISAMYPNIKFILLHQGCCKSRRIFPLLKKRNNVYFTTEQMLDYFQLEEIEEKCGCDQLLFGSAYPKYPHAGALGLVMYAEISEENRRKILFGNWEGIKG